MILKPWQMQFAKPRARLLRLLPVVEDQNLLRLVVVVT
jgi:hypothetical protein